MNSNTTGAVVLNVGIADNMLTNVIHYIKQTLQDCPDNLQELLREPPVVLCRNIAIESGSEIVGRLGEFGLSATFIPNQLPTTDTPPSMSCGDNDSDGMGLPLEIEQLRRAAGFVEGGSYAHQSARNNRTRIIHALTVANKELWIILSMVAIAGLFNFAVASQYLLLGLYTLPTIMSAFFFGRRQAVMTAFASLLTVGIIAHISPALFEESTAQSLGSGGKWYHIMSWGSILILTAYTMGTLYEKNKEKLQELRSTYQGLLIILRHFISQDEYTENHCYRVSIYSSKIAAYMGFDEEYIQEVRSAALLHDIGKLKVSREILHKAAKLSHEDRVKIEKHVDNSAGILEPMRGPLGRILPMILGHHDKFDGSGYHDFSGEEIPLGARILAVADVYDALVSDRPYRKAMSPFEVKEIIINGRNKEFDPRVVDAFVQAFDRQEMEIPNVMV